MNPELQSIEEILQSSQEVRDELMTAVGKLDSYIEQLRSVVDSPEGDGARDEYPSV